MNFSPLLFNGDVSQIENALLEDAGMANTEIPLPDNPATAHPLHRICDAVFAGKFPESVGVEMAKVFLQHGADLNLQYSPGKDSPLTAACSLRCDHIALLYIEMGARIDHPGCHGGTALHWAAWCGRDIVVQKVLELNPKINQLCIDFKSTPLFWALHGYRFGGKENRHHQIKCAGLLLDHGADPSIPNFEGYLPKQLVEPDDTEAIKLLPRL